MDVLGFSIFSKMNKNCVSWHKKKNHCLLVFLLVNGYKYHWTVETFSNKPCTVIAKTYINWTLSMISDSTYFWIQNLKYFWIRLFVSTAVEIINLFFHVFCFVHLMWAVISNIAQQQRLFKCYFSASLPLKNEIRVKGGQHRLLICVTSDSEGKLRIRHALIKGQERYFENWGLRSPVSVQIPSWWL